MNDEKFKAILANHKTGGGSGDNDDGQPAIGSIEEFTSWKHDFLNELKEFLDPVGIATAREADEELYVKMEGLAKACMTTKTLCKEGKIGADHSTVAGQKTINELCTTLKDCEVATEAYVPKTSHASKKAGYTKFDLAAVAIRDGFRVYGLMCATKDYLAGLVTEGGPLESVLRDNQLATVMYFFVCLEAFAETMADLGIYRVMEDCVEVYKVRPRGKKKKKSKNNSGDGDALALSSDEERTLQKLRKKKDENNNNNDDDDDDDGIVNGGKMFSNKTPAGKKTRAIMDNGWSNGFAPGEEVKGPDGGPGKKSRTKKPKSKREKNSGGKSGGGTVSGDDDGESRDGTDDDDENNPSGGDPTRSRSKRSPKKGTDSGDDDGGGEGDDNSTTEPTDDDNESYSEDEDEEDDDDEEEDYVYYFDPVQKVVGKLLRSTCQKEKLIVNVDASTGAENLEGVVDHWETKDEETPGKTDLLVTLREVLRSKQ